MHLSGSWRWGLMKITNEEFSQRFAGRIRVSFNWPQFRIQNWPVEKISIDGRRICPALRLPWYVGVNGMVSFDEPGASPVRLSEVDRWYSMLPEQQRTDIDNMRVEYLRRSRSLEPEIPVYALQNGEYLVMDGNHRLSALALSALSFSVDMWVVHGPIAASALGDLKYFSPI